MPRPADASLPGSAQVPMQRPGTDSADTRFSVMTFNLRFGRAEDGENNWERRQHLFPELFDTFRPDLIGFQEANDFQVDYLRTVLPEYEVIGQYRPAPDYWQSNVIFYRRPWRCLARDHFFLSSTPDVPSRFSQSRWPRQCTVGLFGRGVQRILCANTHFDFAESVQEKSASLILSRLDRMPKDLPAILMGDFNAAPGSACYRIFTGKDPGRKEGFFLPVFRAPYPGTHHGFTGRLDGDHIDWILYRGKIKPLHRGVWQKPVRGRYPSDHFPVYAIFGPAEGAGAPPEGLEAGKLGG